MGILGLGSTLTMLRMPYGSVESVAFTEQVNQEMAITGWQEALELAREKGPAPIMEEEFEVTAKMLDRKSTRLNSSHVRISYAVFCLKKKKKKTQTNRCLSYR